MNSPTLSNWSTAAGVKQNDIKGSYCTSPRLAGSLLITKIKCETEVIVTRPLLILWIYISLAAQVSPSLITMQARDLDDA